MLKNHILVKNKNFRLLVIGHFVSSLGTNLQSFALSLYVLNLTGSASTFAAVLSVSFIPRLLLLPFMGVFADWFDRKKMLVGLDFFSGVIILAAGGYHSFYQPLSLTGVYFIVLALSLISCLFQPTAGSMLPMVTSKDERPTANSIKSFFSTLSGIASPIIAGILMGIFGIGIILFVNGISFILSAISEHFIVVSSPKKDKGEINAKAYVTDLKEGLRYTFTSPILVSIMTTSMLINCFLGSVYNVVMPFSMRVELGYSETLYGISSAFAMSGMLIGMFFFPRLQKRISANKIVTLSTFMISFLTVISGIIIYWVKTIDFGLFIWIILTSIMMIVGAFIIMSNIAYQTIFQNTVDKTMYGRVGSLMNTVSIAIMPMGQMIVGMMTESFSSHVLIVILGISGCFVAMFYSKMTTKQMSEPSLQANVVS